MKLRTALALSLAVLVLDQWAKVWIKTHLMLGEEIRIADWFILHFTENPGMAFGFELGGNWGKLALSLFRVAAVGFIVHWLFKVSQRQASRGAVISLALILAGAAGNLIDSMVYGLFFDHSYGQVATWFPEGGGYAGFLKGKVVDMLYFPLIDTQLPEWLPVWGGRSFRFFEPIFNVADTSISVGIGLMILHQKELFPKEDEAQSPATKPAETAESEDRPADAV